VFLGPSIPLLERTGQTYMTGEKKISKMRLSRGKTMSRAIVR